MNRNKIVQSLVILILVLSFTVTTVGAQAEPPAGMASGSDLNQATPLPDEEFLAHPVEVQGFATAPIAPIYQYVFTRTPKFFFTRNPSATLYRVTVYDTRSPSMTLVYRAKGPGTCGDNYCWLQPTTKLKTWQYPATTGGLYAWTVEAKTDGGWQDPADAVTFTVVSKGFTSTFDVNTNKWLTHGTWKRVDPGYLKTKGTLGEFADARESEFFADGYVYTVIVKHSSQAYIYFDGQNFNYLSNGVWAQAFYFTEWNNGNWALWKSSGGSEHLLASGSTPYINIDGWNKYTIWVKDQIAYIYVNEMLVKALPDTSLSTIGGYVGVGMYQNDVSAPPLMVDFASVSYSSIAPYAVPLTAEGELDPAYIVTPQDSSTDYVSTTFK